MATPSSPPTASPGPDRSGLLGQDYWLVWSVPVEGLGPDELSVHVPAHVAWLLGLEEKGLVLASGPLLSGPGTAPGAGVTVLRAPDEPAARAIAEEDPFVLAGLRTFRLHRWRLNEGSVSVRLSLGTGTFDWQ